MKKQNLKTIISRGLVVVSIFTLSPIGASAEWKQNSNGWWNTEGSSRSVGWKEIDEKWYYFGQDGYMMHDITIDGYKLGSDGAWIKFTQNNSLSSENDKKVSTSDNKNFTIDQFVSIMKTKVDNLEVKDAEKINLSTTARKIITLGDEELDVSIYNSNK